MKKMALTLLAGVLSVSIMGSGTGSAVAASEKSTVEVLLHTKKMKFPDAKPFQDRQGSVMVPIRFVSEALGAKVTYSKNGKVSRVGIQSEDHKVEMTIGQTAALVNGKQKDYGTQIILKQNRTFVPLRLVSEGLGQKVEWDKIGRWVWIGNKDFRSTDDKEFKLTKLSEFKAYTQTERQFTNTKGEKYSGLKIIKQSDLPLQLGEGQILYHLKMGVSKGQDVIEIRSSERGNPIAFLIKNSFARGRQATDILFENNGDKTGLNRYPVQSGVDVFQNGEFVENYDYSKFQIKQADYILLKDDKLSEYAIAIENPFK